ncbi:MAG: hypothetical protein ABMA64_37835 [Myxococcota bacterium]
MRVGGEEGKHAGSPFESPISKLTRQELGIANKTLARSNKAISDELDDIEADLKRIECSGPDVLPDPLREKQIGDLRARIDAVRSQPLGTGTAVGSLEEMGAAATSEARRAGPKSAGYTIAGDMPNKHATRGDPAFAGLLIDTKAATANAAAK